MHDRYDMDEAGTINSEEELRSLVTSLCLSLNLLLGVHDIDSLVNSLLIDHHGDLDASPISGHDFLDWFKGAALAAHCSDGPHCSLPR